MIKAISSKKIIEAHFVEGINQANQLVLSLPLKERLKPNIFYALFEKPDSTEYLMFKLISEDVQNDRVTYNGVDAAYDELKGYGYVKDIRPVKRTAKEIYGARGFCAHHNVDIWRYCDPACGDAQWGFWNMSGAWFCQHVFNHYLYTNDKEYLKECLVRLQNIVSELKLELNGKTQIIPFHKGIRYLGFHHYVTADGKYIRKLKGENKRRMQKKIRTWAKLVKSGRMTEQKFYEKYNAWKNHALHGNCIKLCHSMDLMVEELLHG